MRIDRLEIENFKCFAKQTIDLHSHFTLFVGENGSGKTSVLDALAIAASIWLIQPPDPSLNASCRNVRENEIRLQAKTTGDRTQFEKIRPVRIKATGSLTQQLPDVRGWNRTDSKQEEDLWLLSSLRRIFAVEKEGHIEVPFPVLAYYGAGRAWLPDPSQLHQKENGLAMRWAALQDCFDERIKFDRLANWFRREAIARGSRGGRWRPGFAVVRRAILRCVPDSDDLWFDADRDELVLSIGGVAQPLGNLSAGQRMMMALAGDIAIRALTQNAFLIPPDELGHDDEPVPRVLKETPGLVLIDELDVHLHPKWQRRVASDLKATFPAIQFVCTSHSPQIIGELKPEEIRILDGNGVPHIPPRSFGMDSDRVLEEVMDATRRNRDVEASLRELFDLIDKEDFDRARDKLSSLEKVINEDDPELTRARALMSFLQSPI
jgi:predicted ATP-binding protein involved in virulence